MQRGSNTHKSYTHIYGRFYKLQNNDITSKKIKYGTTIKINILSNTWSDHVVLSRGLCLRNAYSGNSFYRPSELNSYPFNRRCNSFFYRLN